jgi:mono/diheme cytochrome c family protein
MKQSSRARRWAKRSALAAVLLLLVLQAVPFGRGLGNPPVSAEPEWDSPRTRELFQRACGDCHSHETHWAWYTRVAPASWLAHHDVEEGREHFNVSTWDRGPGDAHEAAHEYEEGEMPPWFYLPLHPEAQLSAGEHAELLAGLRATFGEEREHQEPSH